VFFSDLSIRRPVFTIILMGMLALFGFISYPKLGVDQMPKADTPYVSIKVVYAGADPDVVETRVLKPIEDACSTISGVKKLTASGVESFGMISIEFDMDVKADRAAQDVRDKVASVQKDLPSDADLPIIEKLDLGAMPVVSLVLLGPQDESPARMTYIADRNARNQLQRINGVGSVDIIGKQEREIHVTADPEKLRTYGLTLTDLLQAVGYGNVDVPGGRITTGKTELLVKTHAEAANLTELRQLVIPTQTGAMLKLGDLASVEDAAEELRTKAAYDGRPALSLLVKKQSDANTVAVAEAVIRQVHEGGIDLPPGYKLEVVQDSSRFTRSAIDDVFFDLEFGAFLAVAVIMLFLRDWRATFISALALPTSVIATFAFMKAMGFTVNILTMMALSLSIGMLIDDAIVVIENIHRHMEMGKSAMKAAGDGAKEIGLAVLATTLSIIAVFVPVALMKGMIGRFFFEFGMTVSFAVLVSLFVSFTLTPMASSRMLRHNHPGAISRAIGVVLDGLDRFYRGTVSWALRHRIITIGSGVAALAGALVLAGRIPTEFMSQMDQGEVDVVYTLPEGTSIDVTYQRGEALRKLVASEFPQDMKHGLVLVGTGMRQKVNEGKVFVKFSSARERTRSLPDMNTQLRKRIAEVFPGEDISVNQPSILGSAGGDMMSKPLNIQLRGNDPEALRVEAERIVAGLRKDPVFVDLTVSDRGTRPQFGFTIDRDKISAAGLAPAQVAMAIRTAINGTEASQFRDGADRYKIIVQAPESYRQTKAAILSMPMRGPMGNLVEVGELIKPIDEGAPAQIDREDRIRQVTIQGNLQGLALGQAQVRATAIAGTLPQGMTMKYSGQGQLMEESFGYMIEALILAIIIIYMVLAAQFESFLHPVTIMVSLPLSIVGALGGLLLTGKTLSIMSFIGVIMLMGLVTKNAILLVDNANQRMAEGKSTFDAVVQAGAARLRPILMTTAAMIFGMLPVALGLGEGSEMRSPMGVTVIGGLITSTLLTLIVVPAIFLTFENARERMRVLFKMSARPQHVEPSAAE